MSYKEWDNKYVKSVDISELVGLRVSNDIEIKGISDHQQKQMEIRKVVLDGVKDALLSPLYVRDIVIDEYGRPSQRFIDKKVTVNVNPETGIIVTAWRTGKGRIKKYSKDDDES